MLIKRACTLFLLFMVFGCNNNENIKYFTNIKKNITILVFDEKNDPVGEIYKFCDNEKITSGYNGGFRGCEIIKVKSADREIIFYLRSSTQTPDMLEPTYKKYKAKVSLDDLDCVMRKNNGKEINLMTKAEDYK